jgi:uncharacterized membrane protein SirB2
MLSSHYLAIRLLHIGCVAFSGALFTARGLTRIADLTTANPSLVARTRLTRSVAFLAAILTFAYIVGLALAHDPAGWLTLLR